MYFVIKPQRQSTWTNMAGKLGYYSCSSPLVSLILINHACEMVWFKGQLPPPLLHRFWRALFVTSSSSVNAINLLGYYHYLTVKCHDYGNSKCGKKHSYLSHKCHHQMELKSLYSPLLESSNPSQSIYSQLYNKNSAIRYLPQTPQTSRLLLLKRLHRFP